MKQKPCAASLDVPHFAHVTARADPQVEQKECPDGLSDPQMLHVTIHSSIECERPAYRRRESVDQHPGDIRRPESNPPLGATLTHRGPGTTPPQRRRRLRMVDNQPSSGPRSSGTSTALRTNTSRATRSSTDAFVAASTTGAATPSAWARSQFGAVTHHRSPGTRPGNRYWGMGVERSFPMDR